jgi:hypothetical protein
MFRRFLPNARLQPDVADSDMRCSEPAKLLAALQVGDAGAKEWLFCMYNTINTSGILDGNKIIS